MYVGMYVCMRVDERNGWMLVMCQCCQFVRRFQSLWEWILVPHWRTPSSHWHSQLIVTSSVERSPPPPFTTCSTGSLSSFCCRSRYSQVPPTSYTWYHSLSSTFTGGHSQNIGLSRWSCLHVRYQQPSRSRRPFPQESSWRGLKKWQGPADCLIGVRAVSCLRLCTDTASWHQASTGASILGEVWESNLRHF